MDKYNLSQHNRSHNGLFMSELLCVHGISPIPNVLQDNFHTFLFCWNFCWKCNINGKQAGADLLGPAPSLAYGIHLVYWH